MKLNFTLKKDLLDILRLKDGEHIIYCVPFDLSNDGRLIKNSYTVVTDARLIIITEGKITKDVPLSECQDTISEAPVDCGMLISTINGETTMLVRFSMKHHIRYSYVAKGIRLLNKGKDYTVRSRERETVCEKCGRAIPGTKECPYCSGRSQMLSKIVRMLAPYKWWVFLILFLTIIASLLSMSSAYILRLFMDDVLIPRSGTVADALKFFMIFIVIGVSVMTVAQIRIISSTLFSSKISNGLRIQIFNKIQDLSISYINKSRPGQLLNRVLWDTREIQRFIDDTLCGLLSSTMNFLFAFIFLLVLNWKLALLSLIFLPLILTILILRKKRSRRLWRMPHIKNDLLFTRLQDVISGIRVVKSYGKEEYEESEFRSLNEQHARASIRFEIFWGFIIPPTAFLFACGGYLITYFGGMDVLNGIMTPGELIQITTYCSMLTAPLMWFSQLPQMLNRLTITIERIYDVIDEEPEIINSLKAQKLNIHGNMSFNSVCFGYDSYEQVLSDINLQVKKGEMIGIVGRSGAGKSTLINLIMRMHDVDEGSITIDGVDIRDIDMHTLHSQIGVVLQETFLFSDTVINNIRYARPEASYDEIIMAAKMANAHDFICKLPDGYNTYVGEKGYSLSGGERQRIAIARAILINPAILILDEATSSLDTESEYQVQEALGRLTEGRTTFAIAHRLSTLRNADRLIVIDDHTIAECGTHNELLEKRGIYYGLVTAQLEINDMSSFEDALQETKPAIN